jgi:LmbE family N-acetylglucosaminyl deacetylase
MLAVSLLPVGLPAQQAKPSAAVVTKAAAETPAEYAARKLALQEMLQRASTTGRILQVVAHPDDEDGSMLTLESRVKGNTAMLFTFTRGEGGQNAQGAVFFDELGILRTLELLAADKEYGAEERFSHVADFGFSKSAEESYAKWGGRDVPLGDLVREVRQFQPDVIVARFSGTPRDGHGHHQASAQMTVQAFSDAANPERFKSEGNPWQASKLYTGLAGDAATLVPDEGLPSALLDGKTPQEVALHGLRHQESQGAGNWKGPFPKVYSSYKLVATAHGVVKAAHEEDFFDGINTSLPALADRFPEGAKGSRGGLKENLSEIAGYIAEARTVAEERRPEAAVGPIVNALRIFQTKLGAESGARWNPLQVRLSEKREQLEQALILAEGVSASLTLVAPDRGSPFVVPGEELTFQLRVTNVGPAVVALRPRAALHPNAYLEGLGGGGISLQAIPNFPQDIGAGQTVELTIHGRLAKDAPITRPYFHRDSPVRDAVYKTEDDVAAFQNLALPDAPIHAKVALQIAGGDVELSPTARTAASRVFIAPAVSVGVTPAAVLLRSKQQSDAAIKVSTQNEGPFGESGDVKLQLPPRWTSDPASVALRLDAGVSRVTDFKLRWPAGTPSEQKVVTASFAGIYAEGYKLVTRADLDAFPYYAPAQTTVSLIDAEIPDKHNVGYIMGVGDTLPEDLTSLGFNVHLLTDEELASGDLRGYDTIVTGIRAYATRAALRDHNDRLLEYCKSGGTFLVQYEQDTDGFNRGRFMPYPAVMGRERVSQEEQPVTMRDPEAEIFRYPNRITAADFDGWVQERGLYFMKEWATEYTPLLSMHDAGEAPLQGGLLVAHYGKGIYIYSALAFFRQLPNGVPGATRLFINLLAAGHNPAAQPVTSASR